ncbi:MAG: type II secretion system F family protein [Legionella sp.]|jgi:type IV pilus assembly protein PilC|nr:type II secretion system F family protein [Legionella sp.]
MDCYHRYRWVGVNGSGQPARGCLEAKTPTLAKIYLHKQGIIAHKISKERPFAYFRPSSRIKSSNITQFIRQLASLLAAQVPLIQALGLLRSGEENPRMRRLLHAIERDVQQGLSLADAIYKHKLYFNTLMYRLIQAGEQSGALIVLLTKLAAYREELHRLHKKMRATLTYPLAILFIAACVTVGLLLFVVPQFQDLFDSFNAPLPSFTQHIIGLAAYIKHDGLITVMLSLGGIYTLTSCYKKLTRTRLILDKCILKLPLLGSIIKQALIARFAHTLAILLSAGTPLVDALAAASNIAHNIVYTHAILTVREHIIEGHSLKQSLEESMIFPNMMIQMVSMGESSGRLESMLACIAEQYDEALSHTIQTHSGLFEPLLMALLGLWVGSLIIAMYLPIFQLGAIVS